jgi:hypothetical protein
MDIIMFEAQRQGRLSFYMVFTSFFLKTVYYADSWWFAIGFGWRRGNRCRVRKRVDR